jgi:uncharacterized repeat protein (TIGR02543 family)
MTARKTAYLAFCAGLLLFGGCKGVFHPEGPKQEGLNLQEGPKQEGSNPKEYTVTYHANSATGTAPEAQTVNAGGSLTLAGQGDLAYPGCTFSGWNTAADGMGTTYNAGDSYTPAASVILYARWTASGVAQYTVTFDADGGLPATQTRTVADGGIVGTPNMPSEPARTNYAFGGWYTERNGGGDPFYVDTAITGNITIYAKWTVIQYTVTFNADGGSPTEEQKTVNSGAWVGTPNMPPNPTRSAYKFGGWYTEKNGGGSQFYVDTVVTGSITVYARWTPDSSIQYTVTFDADGGNPATQTRTVTNGSFAGASMPAPPAKGGSVFGGWYTEKNGGGTPFTAETTVTGNLTVYARWTVQHTVSFDADDGSSAVQTRTVLDGNSTGVLNMPSEPTRTHYTFGGWYTAKNGGGTEFTAETTVTGNITVYARWAIIQYAVTFNADGGSPAAQTKTVDTGSSVGSSNMPSEPVRVLYVFGGWYTGKNGGGTEFTASTVVTANITVYAKWTALSLNDALTWISSNAVEGGVYTITLMTDETIAPKWLFYSGKKVGITLAGGITERTVSLSTTGSLFVVGNRVTLTLGNNVTLQGRSDNTASLVQVNSGTLVMNTGSKISGNRAYTNAHSHGGGVYVNGGGMFEMTGGEISENRALSSTYSYGGGVYIADGTFTMTGGEISGNRASPTNSSYSYGGGVYIAGGMFTMTGGEISGNTATVPTNSYSYGGGVYIAGGMFTMTGGEISGNTASSDTSSYSYGGGVYVNSGGMFEMTDGEISGNTAFSGGGVNISGGMFTMTDGEISGNTASQGGGVHVSFSTGTFIKQAGGTIYGSNASGTLKNTATSGKNNGQAVHISGTPAKNRNTTAGTGVTLDSRVSSTAGGWE